MPATDKITRFEVIDETGRLLVKYGVSVELSFQDNNRTLKVFLTDRGNANEVIREMAKGLGKFNAIATTTWLPHDKVKNPNRKWYEVWKPKYVWKEIKKGE